MLSLLPAFILLLSAIVIQVVGRVTKRAGSTWWLATIFSSITWLSLILVGLLDPQELVINDWLPAPYPFTTLIFEFTEQTWIFGFLLVTMLLAVILYNARHLESPYYLNKITGSMVITAFGLLAVLSRSNLAFVLTWSLIDLAEFGVLAAVIGNVKNHQSKITSVLFRAIGIILLVLFISITPDQGLLPEESSTFTGWLLVLIVLFRMGILPLMNLPYAEDSRIHRGLVTILQLLPVITVFSFITTLSGPVLPIKTINTLMVIFSIAILYGSISWFFSREELTGRPYWILTVGCLGVVSYLIGKVDALTGLAVVAVVVGSGLFLYTPRFRKVYPYIPLLLVGMLTFPFTPTVTLTRLFAIDRISIHQVLWILSYAILLAGVIKHALAKDQNPDLGEPWIRLFHSITLYFIAMSPWVILSVSYPGLNSPATWWVTLSILGVSTMMVTLHLLISKKIWNPLNRFSRFANIGNTTLHILDELFKFTWLSRLIASLGYIFEKLAYLLIRVQEGDGGILWSFLFLVLLFSLLLTRQVP